jgi:drug/metabolite transporter (DMT)-like permease
MMKAAKPWPQILRAALVIPASALMVLAVKYMPLADATLITFTSPFLVALLPAVLLGERLRRYTVVGIIGGFAGVLIVLRPGQGVLSWYALLPLGTAVFSALYQIWTRHLSRTTPGNATLFQTTLYGTVITSIAAWQDWIPPDAQGWAELALSGIVYGIAQTLMILGFAMAAASVLAPFLYFQLLGALLFDFAFFFHVPDWNTVGGICVLVLSGVYMVRRAAKS